MVNNYNLEWELLKKSRITNRSPKSIMGDEKTANYQYNLDSEEEK